MIPTIVLALLLAAGIACADDLGTVIVHTRQDGKPVADVTVRSGATHAVTDRYGRAALSLPRGPQTLVAEKLGLMPDTLHVDVRAESREITIDLTEGAVQLDEVVVATTRTERRVADDPTRVEVTGQEDVEEQLAASPGNVAELLDEAGGVRIVDTAAPLGSASVRIRGLDGRYTKLLSDGLPLFGLSTEGLAPLQVSPLDLDRVEIVKGVASALYGPTALGGVVNLVSRRPGGQHELLLNRTSHGGTDIALWDAGARHDSGWGRTLLATGDFQSLRDMDGDGWADLASVQRGVLRPRVFFSTARISTTCARHGSIRSSGRPRAWAGAGRPMCGRRSRGGPSILGSRGRSEARA